MDLFSPNATLTTIPLEDGELAMLSQLPLSLDNATVLARLLAETAWRSEFITLWGKRFLQPRLTAWYGDASYTYSGLTMEALPFTPLLAEIKQAVEAASGRLFNSVLLNYYRNERDSMVEAGYTDIRKANHSYTIGTTSGTATTDGSRSYLAAKATMPVNDAFSVYGKLGAGYSKTKFRATTLASADDSKTEVYAGLGGQYKLSDRAALVLEYERYGKSKDVGVKADAITVGARYSF